MNDFSWRCFLIPIHRQAWNAVKRSLLEGLVSGISSSSTTATTASVSAMICRQDAASHRSFHSLSLNHWQTGQPRTIHAAVGSPLTKSKGFNEVLYHCTKENCVFLTKIAYYSFFCKFFAAQWFPASRNMKIPFHVLAFERLRSAMRGQLRPACDRVFYVFWLQKHLLGVNFCLLCSFFR